MSILLVPYSSNLTVEVYGTSNSSTRTPTVIRYGVSVYLYGTGNGIYDTHTGISRIASLRLQNGH